MPSLERFRPWHYAAAAYNALWGAWVVLLPRRSGGSRDTIRRRRHTTEAPDVATSVAPTAARGIPFALFLREAARASGGWAALLRGD